MSDFPTQLSDQEVLNRVFDASTNTLKTTATASGGGEAVTVADGADVTQGVIADAAVTAGATGTLSAKLRAISRDIGTIVAFSKVEDAPSSSGDLGVYILGVRNDAQTTLTNNDGDYTGVATDGPGNSRVVGSISSGSTDSGAPVKVGGKYNSTLPTFTDGQRGDLQLNPNGGLILGGSTVASGSSDSGNPIKIGGKYNTSAPTLTNGQRGDIQLDANANQLVREQYAPVYEDNVVGVAKVEQRFSYAYIVAGQATTTVKSGAGFLHSIVLGSAATATNVTTVFDNTAGSGTTISKPAVTTATIPNTLLFDCLFSTGLTILTATANGGDMTVVYR